jgi:hypothetical protein
MAMSTYHLHSDQQPHHHLVGVLSFAAGIWLIGAVIVFFNYETEHLMRCLNATALLEGDFYCPSSFNDIQTNALASAKWPAQLMAQLGVQ